MSASSETPFPALAEIADAVRNGDIEPDHHAKVALDRIKASRKGELSEPSLNAFLSVVGEPTAGVTEGPLSGVPVAVKDNLATVDLATTCASRILEGYHSPFDATVVRRLREAGAVIVGKTNMDEFAMGSSTENSAFGPTLNPRNHERVPGGSSGGSAAAVAAGLVPAALGSDTGGSVRQPASLCGIVGIKPTYGRVSRYGLVAFASSLDQVGTFGRTVGDAALLLQVIAGHDPRDSTADTRPVPDFAASVGRGVEGMTVGVPRECFPETLDDAVAERCRVAIDVLRDAGASVREVSLPNSDYAIATYYVIAPAEASSNLARYDGVRYGVRAEDAVSTRTLYDRSRSRGFGPEVKRRILLGTYVLSAGYYDAYYGKAQAVRRLIVRDFRRVFADGVDVVFTPTSPTPAFRIGAHEDDPASLYLADVFTVTANLAGIPAISVPVGESDGLPLGGQILAPHWREEEMLRAAGALEAALGTLPVPDRWMAASGAATDGPSREDEG